MDLPDIPTPLASSRFYPMLMVSLLAQNYTPQTETTLECSYDYIVVGAGSAGSAVASRLSEDQEVTVLLLEAGPSPPPITEIPAVTTYLFDSYIDWNINTVPQVNLNYREIPHHFGKCVGGSSVLSFGQMTRGNRLDYDNWAEQGAEGWSYDEVLEYFKKLEDYKVPKYFSMAYHGLHGPVTVENSEYKRKPKEAAFQAAENTGIPFIDVNAESQLGFSDSISNIRNGRRCSMAKSYLTPPFKRDNLHIVANAFVTNVIILGGVARGIEVEYQGENYAIFANREVILSAGAVHTPQILMLSGIGPSEQLQRFNIPVIADLPVGQNLQDHPTVWQPYAVSPQIPTLKTDISDPANIDQFVHCGSGPLASPGGLDLTLFRTNVPHLSPDDVPDTETYFIDGGLPEGQPGAETVLQCAPQILKIRSRGTVKLQSSDPHVPPLVDPNYFSDPQDLKNMIEGLKYCDSFMASPDFQDIGARRLPFNDYGCEAYNGDDFFACVVRNGAITAYHPVGTAKMGNPYDTTTVVDPQLRVKGIKRLRVVDGSVMPTIINGNVQTPIVMIAEKAADIIKSYWNA